MEPFFKFFIEFQVYFMGIVCIYGNIISMMYGRFAFHYSYEDFYDYRYMGKTAKLFNLLWITVGLLTIYGVFKKIHKLLYPFAILFTVDLFLLILRDIVVIWINHRWARVNFIQPISTCVIFFSTMHAMMSLVALGKIFDREVAVKTSPNSVRFRAITNETDELADEDTVVLAE